MQTFYLRNRARKFWQSAAPDILKKNKVLLEEKNKVFTRKKSYFPVSYSILASEEGEGSILKDSFDSYPGLLTAWGQSVDSVTGRQVSVN